MLIVAAFMLFGLIEPVTDLAATARIAVRHEQPIVLYVSRADCTFCRALEREVLGPLIKSQIYAHNVQFRELAIDRSEPIKDFTGRATSPAHLARRYDLNVAPTILFLNAKGDEVAARIVGYNRSELFSLYLERAIDKARAQTKSG